MGTTREPRHSVYVVLLDEHVGTLPQMRRRNAERDPSKPCVYVGITPLRVGRRFDFRGATPKSEWRVHIYGVGLMSVLYEHLKPMTPERALQTARKLADDLRAKGFGVANGMCTGSQTYKSSLAYARRRKRQTLSGAPMRSNSMTVIAPDPLGLKKSCLLSHNEGKSNDESTKSPPK